ncbi:MAG: acetylornithine/succinylornithine family transaminase [Actinobacteria bacterium]|nr:acetylornithine/succinylornithine family transaminase [Actinomycetota bacterium]
MSLSVAAAAADALMSTYPAPPVTFVSGHGTELFDDTGKRYLDFLCGLAVTSLGHAHPRVAEAISGQARTLLHVSNLYGTQPGPRLAAMLNELLGGGGRVFFANSGAEANEAAIKLARKWGGPGRHVVLTADRSFHGRTLATLHATGQPEKHAAFQPLPEGFRHVPWDDLGALSDALTPDVAAILLEPIQGEGGVRPPSAGYLEGVQALCRESGVLFMVDEVQTGLGRTGRWFAHQRHEVSPDVVTMAKALGNGFPIGAAWARAEVAATFQPGDHATTFGGQPLAAAAATAVVEVMMEIDAPKLAVEAGKRLSKGLRDLPGVAGVRGCGLMIAAELEHIPAAEAASRALQAGLVVNAVTKTALRLTPPLTVSEAEIDEALDILRGVLV